MSFHFFPCHSISCHFMSWNLCRSKSRSQRLAASQAARTELKDAKAVFSPSKEDIIYDLTLNWLRCFTTPLDNLVTLSLPIYMHCFVFTAPGSCSARVNRTTMDVSQQAASAQDAKAALRAPRQGNPYLLPQQTSSSDGFHSLQLSTKAVKEARSSCRDEWRLFSQEAALTLRAVVKATTLSCSSATRAKESSSSADSQLAPRPRHRPKAVPKATMSDAGPSSLQASSL